jgi:hypothetical protein
MAQDDDPVEVVRRRVTVTAVRKTVVTGAAPAERTVRVPCTVCGREVDALTPSAAGALLRADSRQLQELVCLGSVHAIATASGAVWICRPSLFPETAP